MAAQKFDFARGGSQGFPCEVGATFSYGLTWQKADPSSPGNYIPNDLTGYTAKMQVRSQPGAPLIVELSTTNGGITLGGTAGTIQLLIAATATAAFIPGLYKYDLDLTDGNGFVTRFIQGFFEIVSAVTV